MQTLTIEEQNTEKHAGRKTRWAAYIVVLCVLVAGAGALLKSASDTHGYTVVSESVEDFADAMRVIRPLIFFIVFCYWNNLAGLFRNLGILKSNQVANLVSNRNRCFLWVALFELAIGQGQAVIGIVTLVGLLIYASASARKGTRNSDDS